jgi:phosphate transport system protein
MTGTARTVQVVEGRFGEIAQRVERMFESVGDGVTLVTSAFLGGDRRLASSLAAPEPDVDMTQREVEALTEETLLDGSISRSEVRRAIAVLRIVPELERSGALVSHIAMRTSPAIASSLTPEVADLFSHMGMTVARMWRVAGTAWMQGDHTLTASLRNEDDLVDDLHAQVIAAVASSAPSVPVAMSLCLVGRFLERLGDHAVNVVARMTEAHRPSDC